MKAAEGYAVGFTFSEAASDVVRRARLAMAWPPANGSFATQPGERVLHVRYFLLPCVTMQRSRSAFRVPPKGGELSLFSGDPRRRRGAG